MKPNKFFSAIFIVFGVLFLNPLSAQRATVPYHNDFSQADLTYWETGFISGSCILDVYNNNYLEFFGSNGDGIGYADLNMDMSQEGSVVLNFTKISQGYPDIPCWSESYANANSGIYLSDDDGLNFTKVFTLYSDDPNPTPWIPVYLNISDLALNHGLNMNNQFVIRFQFYAYGSSNPSCNRSCFFNEVNVYSFCPKDMSITTGYVGVSREFLASNQITATNGLFDGAIVHYGANSSVKLQTGFRVYPGVSFVADLNGCTGLKSANLVGSNEEEQEVVNYCENIVNIYPNPSQGQFNISVKNESKVTILNSFGTVVYKGTLQVGENKVDLSQNSKGLFVIIVDDGNQVITEKVLKE